MIIVVWWSCKRNEKNNAATHLKLSDLGDLTYLKNTAWLEKEINNKAANKTLGYPTS